MNSPYVPAGPEAAPTSQTSQLVASPTLTPQSSSSTGTGLSPASTVFIAVFLSLFGLAALGMFSWIWHSSESIGNSDLLTLHDEAVAVCWMRRRRTPTKVVDEQLVEKAGIGDIEAAAATRPIIPITPLTDVRWTPQIRSISGPAPDELLAGLPPKRARSPPPSNYIKPLNLFPDSYPKSAPAYALSFSQNEALYSARSSRGDMSPTVTPQALAVSGMQTRSLGRLGFVSKS